MSTQVSTGFVYFAASTSLMYLLGLQRRALLQSREHALQRVGRRIASVLQGSTGDKVKPTTAGCDECDGSKKANGMLGSVKPYDRHVIICAPSDEWESDIDKHANTFPYSLINHFEKVKQDAKLNSSMESVNNTSTFDPNNNAGETAGNLKPTGGDKKEKEKEKDKGFKIKLTAMHDPNSSNESTAKVMVYPDNLLFTLYESQFEQFAQLCYQPEPLVQCLEGLEGLTFAPPPWQKLVLVCVHNARDRRCGRAGPQVIEELNRLLEEVDPAERQSICVRGSSHIGGHKYAGTLIVYPQGTWYGRITKPTVQELLQNIRDNTILETCLRGHTQSKHLMW
mmetsp:Transcript_11954/g.19750  ORF Transcript_11954/g.19750 Transcript_11954/m.19750 type:complete len:338 (-) Transcript_11954:1604-2617(-)